MLKRRITVFLVLLAILFNITAVCGASETEQDPYNSYDAATVSAIMGKTDVFNLKAKSTILMDGVTGTVLLEDNAHEKLPIASITKIMSMLLLMEAIDAGKLTMDEKVTVTEHAYSMGGSQVWLEPGEVFTVEELLKAVAIHSANDATVALAEKIAGSEDVFVSMMNERAKELGMNDTNFMDCTGLTDEGHYSSAYDIAIMSRQLLMRFPQITKYTTIWLTNFREGVPGKNPVVLNNTNKLIRFYEGANGLKTGFTNAAGFCLSAAALRNGLQLFAVVLGEPDSNTRFAEARKLLDYGFSNYESRKVNDAGEIIKEVNVSGGLESKINAIYEKDVKLLLKKGTKGNIERVVQIEDVIKAPVKKGQKIGSVVFTMDGNEIAKVDAVADKEIKKASFIQLFARTFLEWFSLGRN